MFKDLYDRELPPPHPGEILREDILPRLGLTRRELAQHLNISTRLLSEFLNERRAVSLDLAVRLGTAFSNGARYWLGLQTHYDIWHAERPRGKLEVKPIKWMKVKAATRCVAGAAV